MGRPNFSVGVYVRGERAKRRDGEGRPAYQCPLLAEDVGASAQILITFDLAPGIAEIQFIGRATGIAEVQFIERCAAQGLWWRRRRGWRWVMGRGEHNDENYRPPDGQQQEEKKVVRENYGVDGTGVDGRDSRILP